jgi:hypothetical protein
MSNYYENDKYCIFILKLRTHNSKVMKHKSFSFAFPVETSNVIFKDNLDNERKDFI